MEMLDDGLRDVAVEIGRKIGVAEMLDDGQRDRMEALNREQLDMVEASAGEQGGKMSMSVDGQMDGIEALNGGQGDQVEMRNNRLWASVESVSGAALVYTTRGDLVENVHRGHVAVVRADGELAAEAGDANVWTYMRSAAKPIQAMVALMSGAVDALGLDDEALALMCASHQGGTAHIKVLERMLAQTGVMEDELSFHRTLPSGLVERETFLRSGGERRKLYHVCAGKHIAMLAVSKHQGWSPASYTEPDHPLQQKVLHSLSLFAGLPPEELRLAVDGCGLPVAALPLWRLALAYARLSVQPEAWADAALRAAAARIAAAMNRHPALVEGSGRLATAMLGDSNVVAKSGAQGIFVFALRQEQLAVAIKLDDGGESAWPQAACAVLEQLRVGGDLADRIRSQFPPTIVNDVGETVGSRVPCLRLRLL
ncbi:asparaginase [Paenibacillus plantiphilus]|nr:asparaginase [Paenibacillus plantiphilus]